MHAQANWIALDGAAAGNFDEVVGLQGVAEIAGGLTEQGFEFDLLMLLSVLIPCIKHNKYTSLRHICATIGF